MSNFEERDLIRSNAMNKLRFEYPLIFDIKKCSMDDGPGVRTVVFLKGCPLRCSWCHNPESISLNPQIAYYPERCLRCGECEMLCPNGALSFGSGRLVDSTKCKVCGRCEEVCPSMAIRKIGRNYSCDELLDIVMSDADFYRVSGGGVTISGGEPTLYMDYIGEFLRKLKTIGIHTAIQTCGYFNFKEFQEKVLPYIDMVFYDIKLVDREEHYRYTGRENDIILYNLIQLKALDSCDIVVRTPLVPGITDTKENLSCIKDLVRDLKLEHSFLEYNPMGISKRANVINSQKDAAEYLKEKNYIRTSPT